LRSLDYWARWEGYPVSATYGGATQFCAVGALERATMGDPLGFRRARDAQTYMRIALEERTHIYSPSVSNYNDKSNRTKAEVLSLFDEAILIAEKADPQ
jgi:hypothetical protein